jgi:hypothetical protein
MRLPDSTNPRNQETVKRRKLSSSIHVTSTEGNTQRIPLLSEWLSARGRLKSRLDDLVAVGHETGLRRLQSIGQRLRRPAAVDAAAPSGSPRRPVSWPTATRSSRRDFKRPPGLPLHDDLGAQRQRDNSQPEATLCSALAGQSAWLFSVDLYWQRAQRAQRQCPRMPRITLGISQGRTG